MSSNNPLNPGSHGDLFLGMRKHAPTVNPNGENMGTTNQPSSDLSLGPKHFDARSSSLKGGLAERVFERAGFSPLRLLDTTRIRPSYLQYSDSPSLAIPPGLSPKELMDSPFLKDSMEVSSVDHSLSLASPDGFMRDPRGSLHQADAADGKDLTIGLRVFAKEPDSATANERSLSFDDDQLFEDEGDPKVGRFPSEALDAPAEDGYIWLKYSEKHAKDGEHPWSYYRCTQPGCQVKKKVASSMVGSVTKIIYDGAHNHPKPSSDCRLKSNVEHATTNGLDGHGSDARLNLRNDDQDIASSDSSSEHSCDQPPAMAGQDGGAFESNTPETAAIQNNSKDDGHRAVGRTLQSSDAIADENESKRRKLEACAIEISLAARTSCISRVVVQTVSDIDIIDDGYRWRKYGQKIVKGNPNPRSYYKCMGPGCSVRKHIERASHDLKFVITTYEGKHSHDVPPDKKSKEAAAAAAAAAAQSGFPDYFMYRPSSSQAWPGMSYGGSAAAAAPYLAGFGRAGASFSFWNGKPGSSSSFFS